MKQTLAFAFTVLLTGGAVWAGPAAPLSGRELESLFAGAAMRGDFVADGSAWAERTTKSGRVLDLLQGNKHVGAWFVAGDRMCYIYFGKPPTQPCYRVAHQDGVLNFHDAQSGDLIARALRIEPSRR